MLRRRALPVDQWPPGDRLAWIRALHDADPLDEPGGAAHWRPNTRHTVMVHYGLWLTWLRQNGHLHESGSPFDRVTPDRMSAYLQELRTLGLASTTIANQFRDLREALRVMVPGSDLSVLDRLLVRLQAVSEPTRIKGPALASPIVLLDAAVAEMQRQETALNHRPSRRAAERYRDALIVAFLAVRPIRLANLAALELGRSFNRQGDIYWCRFTARETKDKEDMEFPMPATMTPWIDTYLARCRPLLLRGSSQSQVWITIRASPMLGNTIYYRVCHVTHQLIGRRINPHLFRDCAATFIAEVAPQQAKIIARLLGHATLATSEKHYNQAGMLSAQKRYLGALATIRGAA